MRSDQLTVSKILEILSLWVKIEGYINLNPKPVPSVESYVGKFLLELIP